MYWSGVKQDQSGVEGVELIMKPERIYPNNCKDVSTVAKGTSD